MNNFTIDRRRFLQLAAAMPVLSLSPSLLAQGKQKKPILLLVELKGGNDALNTLVPYEDENYYRLRPKIAVKPNDVLKLGNGMGMNPAMKALLPEWQSGDMAWVQGIGYPEPNRSHFRSIEIWETASPSDQYLDDGWITQLFSQGEKKKSKTLQGVTVGSDTGPLGGKGFNTLLMQNKESFIALTKHLKAVEESTRNDALAHVLGVQNNIQSNAQLVTQKLQQIKASDVNFPKGKFAKQLQTTAQIISSGMDVPIFKVELGGFDTHNNQVRRQKNLLKQLSEGLAAFSTAMKKAGLWDDVLIMTYSEFGRRAKENKSAGTDHGTAAAHFVLGGRVKGGIQNGLIGKAPSLTDLDKNDLKYTTDFRSYYHTIASQWLNVDTPWSEFGVLPLIET